MATQTKKPIKKTKSAAAKTRTKTTVKKAPSTPKKVNKQTSSVRSFRLVESEEPFFTFSFTRESVYWLILGVVVIVFGLWIAQLQADIETIYDNIDANARMLEE